MRRLLLVRHAPTSATRTASFPVDEPLDERGEAGAAALAGRLPGGDALCSPALRCRQTAASIRLAASDEPALAECDFGDWSGRRLDEVAAADPDGVAAWMTDPACAPHGGESTAGFSARIGAWLAPQAQRDGTAVCITHGGVVRAAVVATLQAPVLALWRLDVAPLSVTELHAHDGRWTVRHVNRPLALA